MAGAVTPPWAIQASSHPASAVRQSLQGIYGAPFASFAGGIGATSGGAHGVVGSTDLAVTQNGTPNMSVNVAGGLVSIRGTEAQLQGVYGPCVVDSTVNLAISASNPSNPRKDLIVAKIRDAQYSGASNDFSLAVVTGTPAASPADPAVPANAVVIARVLVGAGVTSIVTANITDLRVMGRSFATAFPFQMSVTGDGSGIHSTASTSFVDIAAQYALNVPANAGDLLLMTLSGTWSLGTNSTLIGFAFAVNGTTLASMGTNGLTQALVASGETNAQRLSTPIWPYTVLAGDISGGVVGIKPRWRTTSSGAALFNDSTSRPQFTVLNMRH